MCVLAAGFEGPLASLLAKQGNNTIEQVMTAEKLSIAAWVKIRPGGTQLSSERASERADFQTCRISVSHRLNSQTNLLSVMDENAPSLH